MRSDSKKLVQSGLLLTFLFLTACGGGDETYCVPAPVAAPVPAPAPAPVITSLGTDFYLTLPDHLCVSNPAICMNTPVINKLIVAASAATTGDVTFNGVITPFSVSAGGQVVITLDPAVVLTTNEMIEAKAIHVIALAPVSVHVVSETTTSADGYLALPTAGLGTSYYVMSYASTNQPGSEFAVVATQNNTTVSITPSVAGATKPAGGAFTVMLNSGETYQFANPAYADLTGTTVNADKPVAVFSGHRFANVPSGFGYGDYLVEQLPDVSIWGKTHHTSPFSGRANYTVRVIASQDGTSFTTMPAGMIGTLNAGQFVDVDLAGIGEFVSSKPVLVAQFMRGYAVDATGKGDPSMVIVTPVEQAMTDSVFGVHGLARTATNGITGPFVNVVTETAALATLMLDNVVVNPALFTAVGGISIYSTGTIQVSPGVHTLVGSLPYSAIVYDYGTPLNAVSYAYPVAAKLTPPAIPAPAPVTPAVVNPTPAVCVYAQGAEDTQSNDDTEHDGHDGHEDDDDDDDGHEDDDDDDNHHHDHHDDGSHGSHA